MLPELLVRPDRDHTFLLARSAHVQARDPPVRDGAAEERDMQRIGSADVIHEHAFTTQQASVLVPHDPTPDLSIWRRHGALPIARAASRTASTMFW